MKFSSALVLTIACAIASFGCGGGTGENLPASQFLGVYSAAYGRAQGSLTVVVESDGSMDILLYDDAEGSFAGRGTIGTSGSFTGTVVQGARTVSLSGQIAGTGISRSISATLTGAFTATATGAFRSDGSVNLFAGSYTGAAASSGGSRGTITFTVDGSGALAGTYVRENSSPKTIPLSGSVTKIGQATFSAPDGDFTTSFTGSLFPVGTGANGVGDWQTTDPAVSPTSGTWSVD